VGAIPTHLDPPHHQVRGFLRQRERDQLHAVAVDPH